MSEAVDALTLYRLAKSNNMLQRIRRATYWCPDRPKRCLLADVFVMPNGGLAIYLPPFRLSPAANEVSDPGARASKTTDGKRRWIERADDQLMPDSLEYWLNCDHVHNYPLAPATIRADVAARRGDVVVKVSAVLE